MLKVVKVTPLPVKFLLYALQQLCFNDAVCVAVTNVELFKQMPKLRLGKMMGLYSLSTILRRKLSGSVSMRLFRRHVPAKWVIGWLGFKRSQHLVRTDGECDGNDHRVARLRPKRELWGG